MVFMSDVQKFGQNRSRNAQSQYKDRVFQFLSMDRNDLNLNTRGSHVKPRDSLEAWTRLNNENKCTDSGHRCWARGQVT